MQNFQQYTPTEILFGRGAHKEVGTLVKKWGGTRVFLIYGGGSAVRSGLLDVIKQELLEAGVACEALGGVRPNPRLSLALEGVKKAIAFQADMVVAIGGGSVIDTAKAVAIGAANPGKDIWDTFWERKEEVKKALPVGVVLTIAAAGSETSNSAVLTNERIGKKAGLSTDFNRPKFAVMNPELASTLPKYQVACGIVDIMMHTLERYFTQVTGNQMTDEIAEGLLRTVIANGRKVYADPSNYDAMSEVMWCGSLSHNGITGLGGKSDFVVHKLGHAIGAMFDEAHGATLSAVWGSWARFAYRAGIGRFARYGRNVWGIEAKDDEEAAVLSIEKTEEYFRSLDMPVCLGQMKMGAQPDEVLHKLTALMTNNGAMRYGTFKLMEGQDVYEVYKAANRG